MGYPMLLFGSGLTKEIHDYLENYGSPIGNGFNTSLQRIQSSPSILKSVSNVLSPRL